MAEWIEIKRNFDAAQNAALQRNLQPGLLGHVVSNGVKLQVPHRPGWLYVRLGSDGQLGVATAYNLGVPVEAHLPVLLRRSGNRLEITAVDVERAPDPDPGNGGGGGGDVPSPHELGGIHHSGTLPWGRVDTSGSSLLDLDTRNHNLLTGIGANDHHSQVHVLATADGLGPDHTISGASAGHVLRASGATTARFAQLQHDDLGGVTPDQHHDRVHNIITGDGVGPVHTITGDTFDLVGAVGLNTLGLHTPSSDPGASAKILRTDAEGNLALDTDTLAVSALHDAVWINSGQPDGSAAMKVQSAVPGDVTLHLQQIPNQTERIWKVTNPAGDELIVLDSVGNLQSGMPGFVSGLYGWQITPMGRAEFLDGYFRGELHASVFVAHEMHASGGTIFVATAGKLENDAQTGVQSAPDLNILSTAPEWAGATKLDILSTAPEWAGAKDLDILSTAVRLDITDPSIGHVKHFKPGDILRAKTLSGLDAGSLHVYDHWYVVNDAEDLGDYFGYWVDKKSGTDTLMRSGAAVVSYGQPGDGRIVLSSDWNYAPYIDIFTVGSQPWDYDPEEKDHNVVPHVRLGRLDGVGVDGVSGIEQYGLIAGTDLTDNNAPYIVASNKQVKLFKVDLTAHDGLNPTVSLTSAGRLKLGRDVENPLTTAFDFDGASGDLLIGQRTGNHVRWDAQTETLHVDALLTIGGSNVASESYANSRAAYWAGLAETNASQYTDAVVSGISEDLQDYANERRVVGTNGTINSAPTSLSWGAFQVRMGDGSTRTVNASPGGGVPITNLAARYYLFVDVTETGNLTLQVVNSLAALGPNSALIAIADKLEGQAPTINTVAGNTVINGGHIVTNTIVANHLVAGAVTAEKIWANNSIGLGVIGHINANGKAYGSNTPGFFLGHHAGAYKFDIGDGNNYLRWDGGTLDLRVNKPIELTVPSSGSFDDDFLYVSRGSGFVRKLSIDNLGSWRFTGFLRSRQDNSGEFWDILDWRNINITGHLMAQTHVSANTELRVGNINEGDLDPSYFVVNNSGITARRNINAGNVDVVAKNFLASAGGSVAADTVTVNQAGNIVNAVTAWFNLTLINGWEIDGSTLKACRIGELIIVCGGIKRPNNSGEAHFATLPQGFRPSETMVFPAFGNGGGKAVRIDPSGAMTYLVQPSPVNHDCILNCVFKRASS